jgi:hypothetical protein
MAVQGKKVHGKRVFAFDSIGGLEQDGLDRHWLERH